MHLCISALQSTQQRLNILAGYVHAAKHPVPDRLRHLVNAPEAVLAMASLPFQHFRAMLRVNRSVLHLPSPGFLLVFCSNHGLKM